jgi:hypothetical protein
MSERDVQEQLNLLRAETESISERDDRVHLELRAEIDSQKIEIETLRRFLTKFHPEFTAAYPALREEVVRAVDPEFTRSSRRSS